MLAFSDSLCREVCAAGPVALEISNIEEQRKSGLVRFWAILGGAALLTVAVAYALAGAQRTSLVFSTNFFILFLAGLLGYRLLGRVAEVLKVPALEAIAAKDGLTYSERDFDPPVYPDARRALFGNWLTTERFSDLFQGSDDSGKRFALYEAVLVRGSGRNRHTVFSGQVYAWQRRARSEGEIVIVPDRGIFNFFKPVSGMERVSFEEDSEFEGKFEVYAFEPQQAMMVLGASLRRALLDLRQSGRVFGYVGPEEVLIAAWGRNRFEPGSMFRAIPGEERVRNLVEDVCAALATLEQLRATIP